MTVRSGRPALQDSSDKRQEWISLQLQSLQLTNTLPKIESVHLLPAAHPIRLSHVWEEQRTPFLEQTLAWKS